MANLYAGINTALQALLSQQQVIDVIENNVANASTVGYHRQSAVLSQAAATQSGLVHDISAGSLGSGVVVSKIQRFTEEFYETRYRQVAADASRWNTENDVVSQTESLLAETSDSGLTPSLDNFFAGWQTLASDASNSSYRTDLLDRANALVNAFKSRSQQLTSLRSDQGVAITQRLDEINSDAQQVANLNGEISRVLSTGDQPNDLLDQRDQLLDSLSQLAGATSSVQSNGEVMVSIAGHSLVIGHDVTALQTTLNAGNTDPVALKWADGQTFAPTTGEIAGLIDARDKVIPDQLNGINALAAQVITQVNTQHQKGFDLNNAAGGVFFSGTDASDIGVAITDVNQIAAAGAAATGTATSPTSDGDNARALFGLSSQNLMSGNTSTFDQYYNNQVTALGLTVNSIKSNSTNKTNAQNALDDQRKSVSGVSLDEEAANLVKAQRAYEAATRMMTTIDSCLDKVINSMGLVGR
jgi:flagellar hook-associated protein 1 FlgK